MREEAERAKRKRLGMDGELGSDEEEEGRGQGAAGQSYGPEVVTDESDEEDGKRLGRHGNDDGHHLHVQHHGQGCVLLAWHSWGGVCFGSGHTLQGR